MTNSSSSTNPCGRILIVDDNSLGLAARRSVLEELGHKVVTCSAPHDGLELCGKQRFDVVVTDYKMPKMNGVEFISRLRKQHSTLSVILISGFTDTLPKTRSGKIMRRLLRELATSGDVKGDTTTLEDFGVIAKLKEQDEA